MVDPNLSLHNEQNIKAKNMSVLNVMEHALLGNTGVNFNAKAEVLGAIIKERTPDFFSKSGSELLSLITRLQKLRNLLAHYITYVYNDEIYVSKPRAKFNKNANEKGVGYFDAFHERVHVTTELCKTIIEQCENAQIGVCFYIEDLRNENKVNADWLAIISHFNYNKGGVFNLKILNY